MYFRSLTITILRQKYNKNNNRNRLIYFSQIKSKNILLNHFQHIIFLTMNDEDN
jgi:hypothetical protein